MAITLTYIQSKEMKKTIKFAIKSDCDIWISGENGREQKNFLKGTIVEITTEYPGDKALKRSLLVGGVSIAIKEIEISEPLLSGAIQQIVETD